MKLRKASVNPWEVATGILLILIVVIIVAFLFRDKVEAAVRSLSPVEVASKNRLCKLSVEFSEGKPKEQIEDSKSDGFPDDCDICLGGDNNQVSNSYGIPDDCYLDSIADKKIKTYKEMCKAKGGCYISDTDQCCLGNVACGPKCKK